MEEVISMQFVEELHKRLFGDVWMWAGLYRVRELNIGVAPHSIRQDLYNLLGDIKCWIEFKHYDSLELSARIQHRLVKVYPFTNGNGRHSRIMTDYIRIVLLNEKPLKWSDTDLERQTQERTQYFASLREADKGEYAPFIAYLKSKGNQ
jgi:Fic-DOC domain mobile mystery protein B